MSLATRCTACGTVFRVVQDQLKVSEGWVRCGRCDQVFNAIEGLFDLERDAPPNWVPPPAPPAPPAAQVSAEFNRAPVPPQDEEEVFHLSDEDRIHSRFFQPEQDDVAKTPAQSLAERDKREFADAEFNVELLGEDGHPVVAPTREPAAQNTERERERERSGSKASSKSATSGKRTGNASSKRSKASRDEDDDSPQFLLAARRRALWRSPGMRALLSLLTLGLMALLLAQAALHHRDVLAARHPTLRPWLAWGCQHLQCEIGLPHRIDDISLESHTLSPAQGGAAYRLNLVLRNRGELPVALPAIDLSLTDSDGQVVSRRALTPADFRVTSLGLAPQGEQALQVLLAVNGARVSGYTVEIFYP